MANLKISQLTAGNPAQSGDLIPIARAGANFSITAASVALLVPAINLAASGSGGVTGQLPIAAVGSAGLSGTSPISVATTGVISAPTAVTSAAALTANQIIIGAGLQASAALGSLGTTTTVLHGNASGAPSFGAVSLATDVIGQLPIAAVGSAGLSGTGPISVASTGVISAPTAVTSAASLTANQLVIGAGSQASATLGSLGTTTTVLHGNAGGAPSFGAVNLATDITGQLPIGSVGSAGLSGTAPISVATTGVISAPTAVTSAASLANGGVVLGTAGTQASATNTQLTFVAPTLTVGLAGTSSGILALTGVTSGSATFTAPGTAGTRTNPVVSSNYFQIGVIGTTSGQLLLAGSTSGTATITAAAIAGTSTNQVVSSNVMGFPSGTNTAPTIGLSAFPTYGVGITSLGVGFFTFNGGYTFGMPQAGPMIPAASAYTMSSTSDPVGGTADTGISRGSAGVVAVGNGVPGNTSGSMNLASLTASGTVRANTSFSANGTAGVSAGAFTAITSITTNFGLVTALSGSSDERLKDWSPYVGGLAEILAITPAIYHWNEKGTVQTGLPREQEYVGFIAQDVQKVIPQAITFTEPSKDGTETYLSLDDRPIIAALVNAIKELTARIKVLELRK